jgi:hypothetical protein
MVSPRFIHKSVHKSVDGVGGNATAMMDLGIPEGLARVVNGACRRSPLSASTAATPTGTDGHLARTPARWCSPSCCRCSPRTGSTPHGWYLWAGPWAVTARCCWARGSAPHARRVSARSARRCGRHNWQPTTAPTAPPTGQQTPSSDSRRWRRSLSGWTAAPRTGSTRPPGNSSHNYAGQSPVASRRAATMCHCGDGNYPMS